MNNFPEKYESLGLIQQSYSVAFADFVRESEKGGRKIIKMQTGDPDFATHPNIVKAAHEALRKGETKYCDSRGLLLLREALVKKLANENNIFASAQNNILITHGAVHGIAMAIRAMLNPGDECIIIEPYWRAYEANIILAGGIPIIVKANSEKCFTLEADEVLERITPRTKIIIINTPNNPSGAVYKQEELAKLARGAAERGVYIISDEVYEALLFDSNQHYSPASDPETFEWIISVFSFSKSHSMTGWRIGYVVANKTLIEEILKLSQYSVTSISPYNQLGALMALNDNEVATYARAMYKEYEKRRDRIFKMVNGTWLEKSMIFPEGAFYILIDLSRFNLSSLELAKKIVSRYDVAFTPGIAFGDAMDSYLRMCFASSNKNIDSAIKALISFEKEIKS